MVSWAFCGFKEGNLEILTIIKISERNLNCFLYATNIRLPLYACKFIEMCLMVTADHGPAVSGAHNTIVCARAGKDLISSLVSGLLTIVSVYVLSDSLVCWFCCKWVRAFLQGDRFGGALDAAAKQFSEAYDSGMIPMEFVNSMRKKGQLIMGVGHRVKSVCFLRCALVFNFINRDFKSDHWNVLLTVK